MQFSIMSLDKLLNISFLAEIATPFLLVPIPPPTELELFMVVPLWIFHCLVCLKLQRSGNSIPYFDFKKVTI